MTQTPWPFYTCRQAAKRLGITADMVQRLAAKNLLTRVVTEGSSGEVTYLLRKDDVDILAANGKRRNNPPHRLGEVTGGDRMGCSR